MSDSITCPKCKTEIPLSKAITHHVEERLRAEFDAEKERLLAEQAKQLADKDAEVKTAVSNARERLQVAGGAFAAHKRRARGARESACTTTAGSPPAHRRPLLRAAAGADELARRHLPLPTVPDRGA
jgi:hypothetical protein